MSAWIAVIVVAAFRASGGASVEVLPYVFPAETEQRAQERVFLERLEEILGPGHRQATESRLDAINQALQTTFASLPKTARGSVSAPLARYAMHRLFVQRHGWHIKGLAPESGDWSPSAPALGVGDRLPKRLLDLFEEQLADDDFHLHEIALLASALESLIHGEVEGRLQSIYKVMGRDAQSSLSKHDAVEVIDTYVAAFLAGYNMSQLSPKEAKSLREQIKRGYAYWTHYEELAREVQHEVVPGVEELAFSDILLVLEAMSERMGHRLDESNCRDIESRLLRLEAANSTGRVKLRDFYESYLNNGDWQFRERVDYLRQLGVLDESDPSMPRIIIPNYLQMQANCLNVSSFYDLCCRDLCEDLLGQLESKIRAPHAAPDKILTLVSVLPSSHVPTNRRLSPSLVKMLEEVAEHHGGLVPLHGRLFAQWMHFAYPMECSYPHLSGTTKLMSSNEWFEETGTASALTPSEMKQYLASLSVTTGSVAADGQREEDQDEDMCSAGMWMPEEELVDAVHGKAPIAEWEPPAAVAAAMAGGGSDALGLRVVLRACSFAAALVSSTVAMRSLFWQVAGSLRAQRGLKSLDGSDDFNDHAERLYY